jgi:hypothetical protein
MGKIGTLVGVLLNENFEVTALEQKHHTIHINYLLNVCWVMYQTKNS